MTAIIENGRVRHVVAPKLKAPAGPVSIPDLRVDESLGGGIRLLAGPTHAPFCFGIFASRDLAEQTCDFMGGLRG